MDDTAFIYCFAVMPHRSKPDCQRLAKR